MFKSLTVSAARLDDWLDRRLGPPYAILLTVGLIAEIGRSVREILSRHLDWSHGLNMAWLLALDGALLIHQVASLHHIRERRAHRSAQALPPPDA